MSNRVYRRLYSPNTLPPPDSNEDSSSENEQIVNKFLELNILLDEDAKEDGSSKSKSEAAAEAEAEDQPKKQTKKKKKKKAKNRRKSKQTQTEQVGEDEIPQAGPSTSSAVQPVPEVVPPSVPTIFIVDRNNLNVFIEAKRLRGPSAWQMYKPRTGRVIELTRRPVIVPLDRYLGKFVRIGLSMSVHKKGDGLLYFSMDHDEKYQKVHRFYLGKLRFNEIATYQYSDFLHVEGMIKYSDGLAIFGKYEEARIEIEHAIAYIQYIAHPKFDFCNPNIRLEYNDVTNRAIHIMLMKYIYYLTSVGFHKTALEVAKLLLILDPSDPLAVIMVIDAIAIRAREHSWLIEAISHWIHTRNANYLLNIQYSNALAHFHNAGAKARKVLRDDYVPFPTSKLQLRRSAYKIIPAPEYVCTMSDADDLLQTAIIMFPYVARDLLKLIRKSERRIPLHEIFTRYGSNIPPSLKDPAQLYIVMTWSWWRETDVEKWLLRNIHSLMERYANDQLLKNRFEEILVQRMYIFTSLPPEFKRHVIIIQPMRRLITGDEKIEFPEYHNQDLADPIPHPSGINRYHYNFAVNSTPLTPDQVIAIRMGLMYGAPPVINDSDDE